MFGSFSHSWGGGGGEGTEVLSGAPEHGKAVISMGKISVLDKLCSGLS